jgi:molybdenum cofactor synthesis domain-containing protein
MNVAIVTVGDEILAGSTTNTNASWLAERITERGSSVDRILTIPDDRELIAEYVARWSDAFDAVIVTGGIGGTPDDVTVEAVADGLEREFVVHGEIKERLVEKAAAFRDENPEMVEEYDLQLDIDAAASIPEGATPIVVDEGWAPGCIVENVYVLAGIPDEMKAMFESVADEFQGDAVARTIYTPAPEGSLHEALEGVTERFDVAVGSYPRSENRPGRIRVSSTDLETVEAAIGWLREHVETTEPPSSSEGTAE